MESIHKTRRSNAKSLELSSLYKTPNCSFLLLPTGDGFCLFFDRSRERCRTFCHICTRDGPWIKRSWARKNVSSSSDSATTGTKPACRCEFLFLHLLGSLPALGDNSFLFEFHLRIFIRGFFFGTNLSMDFDFRPIRRR